MKKIYPLLIAALCLSQVSCYKNSRVSLTAEEAANRIDKNSKWDWTGEGPISGVFEGRVVNTTNYTNILKIQNTALGSMMFNVNTPDNGNFTGYAYTLTIQKDLKPGTYHIASGEGQRFRMMVSYPIDLNNYQMPGMRTSFESMLKLEVNDATRVVGKFYSIFRNGQNPLEPIKFEQGYFNIDKSDMVYQ